MNTFTRNLCALTARLWPAGVLVVFIGAPVHAATTAKLGSGLSELVQQRAAEKATGNRNARAQALADSGMMTMDVDSALLRDDKGRVMVNVIVDGRSSHRVVRARMLLIRGVEITAEDTKYRAGIIEGWVPETALEALAKLPGVSAVHGVNRPGVSVGSTTSQGVVQHRVDQLPANINGTGITIGVLSDSYNTAQNFVSGGALTIREAQDIASCDLPGAGNPCGNTTPVTVLGDMGTYPNASATDEGRAMVQLIHDMAPKARLGFATAFNGDVSFANNIRALAGMPVPGVTQPGFAAQIIVDDVQYFNEGMFADTVIAQAVDDVTAAGVTYFSSAGNTPPTQGYASDFRYVPVGPNALAGTNINLTGVPTSAYAGGFHNFRSDGGQDIAQTITLGTNRQLRMTLQWDDPYDVTPSAVGALISQTSGTLGSGVTAVDVPLAAVAGKNYVIDVQGDSTTAGAGNLDVIVTVIDANGATVTQVDTGASENFAFYAPSSGAYKVRVTGYNGDTGTFVATINQGTGVSQMTSDFNLLFFHPTTGAYLGCSCENNLASNRPIELPGSLTFPTSVTTGQVQLVIARANIPGAPNPASRLRYKMLASTNGTTGNPAEYFSYSTPITYGHNSAAGANGVAAYSPFRPNVPEDFTSTGPVRIVWDRNNQRIPEAQQIRLKPEMAAMDGGNTTFFISDTNRDLDTFRNFFGTSAAAPTAAGIAALVLQAKGGPGSVTPAQMRVMLQRSAFQHDLDPYSARAQAISMPNRGKVTITLDGDLSNTARIDPNAFSISYTGPSSITSITFDGSNGNPGGGNVVVDSTPGLVFDTRTAGQPFVVGNGSVGLTAGQVTATNLNPAPAPSVAGQNFGLKLDFTPGAFTAGKTLRFGVGRAMYRSPFSPPTGDTRAANSADLAGSIVRQPEGTVASGGITFTGTLADGSTFSGTLVNRLGTGWTFLDGYGFINAQSAVNQPLP